jgi:hypothetical protein
MDGSKRTRDDRSAQAPLSRLPILVTCFCVTRTENRKVKMNTKYEITCPNADEVFIVDEQGLHQISDHPLCWCGLTYEITEVPNV